MPPFIIGLAASSLVGLIAYQRESLSKSGVLGAILTGTLAFTAGWEWAVIVLAFFVSSSALSKINTTRKAAARQQFRKGEQRDLWQVLANGGIAAAIAFLYILTDNANLWAAYLGAFAAATADTWATEIGTLSRQPPRLITTFKPTDAGASGAVTLLGTLAALGGAVFIAGVGVLIFDAGMAWGWVIIAATVAGLLGSLFDSFLGATVQALYWCNGRLTEKPICKDGSIAELRHGVAWVNNEVVNLAATGLGCFVGWLIGVL